MSVVERSREELGGVTWALATIGLDDQPNEDATSGDAA